MLLTSPALKGLLLDVATRVRDAKARFVESNMFRLTSKVTAVSQSCLQDICELLICSLLNI